MGVMTTTEMMKILYMHRMPLKRMELAHLCILRAHAIYRVY